MYVRELMTPRVVTVKPSDSLSHARELLRANRIHHLIVVDGTGRVTGILSYRELIVKGDASTVGEVMSRDVATVTPWDTVRSAAAMMLGRTSGCLPVMNGDEVAGIITTTDLLRAVSTKQPAHAS